MDAKVPLMECAPGGGQDERFGLTIVLGFQRMKAMTKHRSHSVAELCRNLGDEAIRRRGLTTLQ